MEFEYEDTDELNNAIQKIREIARDAGLNVFVDDSELIVCLIIERPTVDHPDFKGLPQELYMMYRNEYETGDSTWFDIAFDARAYLDDDQIYELGLDFDVNEIELLSYKRT